MQVYKAFFKIILKNLNQIMIYVVVFLLFAVLLTNTYKSPVSKSFTETKINIVFINKDKDSKLAEGLRDYLSKNANIIDMEDNTKKLQDALFFRKLEYIVRVPEGFTDNLLSGKAAKLEKTTVPDSTSGMYIDSIINKYLNTAKTYSSYMKSMSQEELVSNINKDLLLKTEVQLNSSMAENKNNEKRAYYFNYMAYSLFAILILGVSAVMIVFNDSDIKKRNLCSPVKLRSMNFQMILGNFSFAVFVWLTLIITSFIMYGSYMLTASGLLLLLNSFVFSLAALSISFLIGNFVKSREAMSAASNVFSLGTSFISGVFVPQALLAKPVLTIASFTPSYWYVKSNNTITNLVNYNMESLKPVFLNMLIIIGFAAAVLAVTLAVNRNRKQKVGNVGTVNN